MPALPNHDAGTEPGHDLLRGRRAFLKVGVVGGLGLSLGDVLRIEAQGAERSGRKITPKAKSIIHLALSGGMAHQESFDPKPEAPLDYRGELDAIETKIPGVYFGQHLVKTAALADRLAVIRSMSHTEAEHQRGEHSMFTGYQPSPALVYPSFGAVTSEKLGPRGDLPPYICIPNPPSTFAGSGFLSRSYGPFSVGSDPARRGFQVRDLNLPEGIDTNRADRRRGLRGLIDQHFSDLESSDQLDATDSFYERAYAMISSPEARNAFDLEAESNETRDAYGRRGLGPRMLLARRLIEAGVRYVSLSLEGWDSHIYHFRRVGYLMPNLDQALAGLIADLEERGLLDETLILVTTEFGRTPKVNSGAGRDHWPRVFSIAMAGGGIKGGYVHGASDALAADPAEKPVTIADYAATLYQLLGIDPESDLLAPGGRPIPIANRGRVITDLLA